MPIYSFKCEKCGRVFDEFLKAGNGNGNNNKVKCIYCNSYARKLFLPTGIIFKGSGFYTTDYKSGSSNSSSSKSTVSGEKKEKEPVKSINKTSDNKKPDSNKTCKKDSGAS